jgi:hypothetical protein
MPQKAPSVPQKRPNCHTGLPPRLRRESDILASFRTLHGTANMPIPLSQLDTWSNRGAIKISSAAYNGIQHAITKAGSPLANRNIEIFLQGSYRNATNIYADSDIDVVVMYKDAFYSDKSALTPAEVQSHAASYVDSDYNWQRLHDDTLGALQSHYGSGAVKPGTKAIEVGTGAGRMTADVLPALRFRKYASFVDRNNYTGWFGIEFVDSSNNAIVNYPKDHIERGEAKNQDARTKERYKPTIRTFKNFRNYLVEKGLLAANVAPSYFLECTLHNVPDQYFVGDLDQTVPGILDYLWRTPTDKFMSQNGVVPLFGPKSTQWSQEKLAALLKATRDGWNTW